MNIWNIADILAATEAVSEYYIKQGYSIVADESPSPHYFGGDPCHEGATCPVCNIPLLLLADFDCIQLRRMESAKLFSELDRLPLYYCWKCCAEKLSYKVSGGSIKIFKNEGKPYGDNYPYAGFPVKFPKRNVKLVPIPYETAKLLAVAQEIGERWLTEKDQKAIEDGFQGLRHHLFAKSCLVRHQIGGLLCLLQGHDWLKCPNPECRNSGVRMLELATIHNDPYSGLPMSQTLDELSDPNDFDEFIQVVYWICDECLTLTASNRCD